MATLKCIFFFLIKGIMFFKSNRETPLTVDPFISCNHYSIILRSFLNPWSEQQSFSINVKLCNAFLHMLLVCVHSYLKAFLRYKFLIWVPVIQKLHIYMSKDVQICGYFLNPRGVHQQNSLV